MKLNSLEIKNLRCFESFRISFTPKTTIIIGRNGAGKSTLIDAIKIAVSFIFSNNKQLGNDFLSAGNPSLNINSFTNADFRYDPEKGTIAPDASVKGIAQYNGKKLDWELYKRSTANASLFSTKYQAAFKAFMHEWKDEGADLPLIACFSDSFPHKGTKQTKFAMETILKDKIPLNFGYYLWEEDTACTSIWETRLCNQLARMFSLQARINGFESLKNVLEEAIPPDDLQDRTDYLHLLDELSRNRELIQPLQEEVLTCIQAKLYEFSRKLPKLYDEGFCFDYFSTTRTESGQELSLVFKNGKSFLLHDLPAGYRRLYSIVLDLAYRSFILNGKKDSHGIVLIDEIDLHLHPSLEQEVVQCLRGIFPHIQFIMTTHSAAVIANLDTTEKIEDENGHMIPANQLVFMQEGQSDADILPVIYGLDYNAALRDFMGSPSRNGDLKKKGDEYLAFCSMGLKEEADTVIGQLKNSLGDNHVYVKELLEKAKEYEVH